MDTTLQCTILGTANGRLGCVKTKKKLLTRERKLFSEIRQLKPSEFSTDLNGKFNFLHTCRRLALCHATYIISLYIYKCEETAACDTFGAPCEGIE